MNDLKLLTYASWMGCPIKLAQIIELLKAISKQTIEDFVYRQTDPSWKKLEAWLIQNKDWRREAQHLLNMISEGSCSFFCVLDDEYPEVLVQHDWMPLCFCYQGDLSLLGPRLRLAMVGSRRLDPEIGAWVRMELLDIVKTNKISIVSGGAQGVDQLSHQLSMQSGVPGICVLPSGIDRLYPKSLSRLLPGFLSQGGLILSSYPPWQSMRKYFFQQRNQILVQLSHMVFVPQASRRSGSAMSVKKAIDLNLPIITLPVSVKSDWQLNLDLLESGAYMLRSGEDLKQIVSQERALRRL